MTVVVLKERTKERLKDMLDSAENENIRCLDIPVLPGERIETVKWALSELLTKYTYELVITALDGKITTEVCITWRNGALK